MKSKSVQQLRSRAQRSLEASGFRHFGACMVLALAAGCSSEGSGVTGGGGAAPPMGTPGPGGPTSPDGTDGPPLPPVQNSCGISPDQPRRLNRTELNNLANDVFGNASSPFQRLAADKNAKFSSALTATGDFVDQYQAAAAAIGADYVKRHDPAAGCAAPDLACAKSYLTPLADLAARRSFTDERMQGLLKVVQAGLDLGLSFQESVAGAIEAMLLAPETLYVGTGVPQTPGAHRLSDTEVATRLSLVLWDSVPDLALLDAAAAGQLRTSEGIAAQVDRLLADPVKGQRFIDSFTQTFAGLEGLSAHQEPPEGVESAEQWALLLGDMAEESRQFARHVYEQNLPIQDFVGGKWTFVNARLAAHYGIPGVTGDDHQLVQLPPDSSRAGVMTHGAFTVQHEDMIFRGKEVNEKFLCVKLPAPPNDPVLLERILEQLMLVDEQGEEAQAQLRLSDPVCSGCHTQMDPIGQTFAAFDRAGRFSPTDENGAPVNTTGMYKGMTLTGPQSVIELVQADEFTSCFSSQILGPAAQRLLSIRGREEDNCAVKAAIGNLGPTPGFRDVLKAAFASELLTSRVIADPASL